MNPEEFKKFASKPVVEILEEVARYMRHVQVTRYDVATILKWVADDFPVTLKDERRVWINRMGPAMPTFLEQRRVAIFNHNPD